MIEPAAAPLDVAAVDLGSNSFHMVVARAVDGELQVLDRLRESVRLAAGLSPDKRLSVEGRERALACLQRFGQRLQGLPPQCVRVAGTSTLRRMKNRAEFLADAEGVLGHRIDIISGREEGRLVYAGVTHGMANLPARRLVVDIGGGSTELIVGTGDKPRLMESVAVGCVVHTLAHFGDGEITRKRLVAARLAARVELEFLERRYRRAGWDVTIGSSGTVRGVWRVMRARGWVDEEITREGLEKLVELLIETGSISKIDYKDLREDRRAVFAGGVAVLAGVFDALGLERMRTSERALREGMLYDLLGRLGDQDVRDEAVTALARRYGADLRHAAQVEKTALRCLEQVADAWRLERKASRLLLSWAARLHEAGLVVAHSGYHKHGEYLVRHCDLAGFSQTDQRLVAALVRLHRGKFSTAAIEELPKEWAEPLKRLAILLRLAVLMHRSRVPGPRVRFKLEADGEELKIDFPSTWLARHALTAADFEREADYLKAAGFKLKVE